MSFHVLFREFDTDREDTDSEDDTGKFQGDRIDNVLVTVAPPAGIEDIGAVWTYTDISSQSVTVAMVRHEVFQRIIRRYMVVPLTGGVNCVVRGDRWNLYWVFQGASRR